MKTKISPADRMQLRYVGFSTHLEMLHEWKESYGDFTPQVLYPAVSFNPNPRQLIIFYGHDFEFLKIFDLNDDTCVYVKCDTIHQSYKDESHVSFLIQEGEYGTLIPIRWSDDSPCDLKNKYYELIKCWENNNRKNRTFPWGIRPEGEAVKSKVSSPTECVAEERPEAAIGTEDEDIFDLRVKESLARADRVLGIKAEDISDIRMKAILASVDLYQSKYAGSDNCMDDDWFDISSFADLILSYACEKKPKSAPDEHK